MTKHNIFAKFRKVNIIAAQVFL